MPLPMTITVLIEDSVSRPILLAEHGLAFWIDMGAQCILFDTGQSHLILANANILRINLDAVDIVVLSHGHYDHCGGFPLRDFIPCIAPAQRPWPRSGRRSRGIVFPAASEQP